MAEDGKKGKRKGGCLGKLVTLGVFACFAGLGVALYFIAQPQDLSDIQGTGPAAVGKTSRDLKRVLEKAHKEGYPVTLTEEEINLYLRDTLTARQGGALASQVAIDRVLVRLEKGVAEVVVVRTIAGRPFTTSMYLKIDTLELPDGSLRREIDLSGGPYHPAMERPLVGGRFGRLKVPQGFIRVLTLDSMAKLAAVYRDATSKEPVLELDYVEDFAMVEIQDGKILLDPRGTTRDLGLPGGF